MNRTIIKIESNFYHLDRLNVAYWYWMINRGLYIVSLIIFKISFLFWCSVILCISYNILFLGRIKLIKSCFTKVFLFYPLATVLLLQDFLYKIIKVWKGKKKNIYIYIYMEHWIENFCWIKPHCLKVKIGCRHTFA